MKNIQEMVLIDVTEFLENNKEFSRASFGRAVCNDEHLLMNLESWRITGKTLDKVYGFMADYKPTVVHSLDK